MITTIRGLHLLLNRLHFAIMKNKKHDWNTLILSSQVRLLALSLEAGLHFSHIYHILASEYPNSLLSNGLAKLEEKEFQTNADTLNTLKNIPHPIAHHLYHIIAAAEETGTNCADTLKNLAYYTEELALLEFEENQWRPQLEINYLEDLARLLNVISLGLRAGLSYYQAVELATDPKSNPHLSQISEDLRNTERINLKDLSEKYSEPFLQIFATDALVLHQTGGSLTEACESLAKLIQKFLITERKIQLAKK